jgi:hypothetical protein
LRWKPGDDVAVVGQLNSQIAPLAAEHAARQDASGITTLVFRVVFLAIGAPFATNFRGVLDRWDWSPRRVPALLRKLPPWRWDWQRPDDRAVFRVITTVFAVVGLVCMPLGLYRIATGKL